MSEVKRKPFWLKFLISLLSIIFTFVIIVGILYSILYFGFKVNLIKVAKDIKTLNQPVYLENFATNSFDSPSNMAEAKAITDKNLPGYITYNETEGYKLSSSVTSNMLGDLVFNDKQVGAILDNIINSQEKIEVQIGSIINLLDYGFKIIQVKFDNLKVLEDKKEVDFNIIVKVELDKLKDKLKFPLTLFKNYIPKNLYLSCTVTINKNATPFNYSTTEKSLVINNLSEKQTEELFKTVNILLKVGSAKEFSKIIADSFVNTLIGNENISGMAYSLKNVGATDFDFINKDNQINYVIVTNNSIHKHTMIEKESVSTVCTGNKVKYYYCSECSKNFVDINGITELKSIPIVGGHSTTIKTNALQHYYECIYCNQIIGDKEDHSSSIFLKNKTQHYKICSVCEVEFDKENHTINSGKCTICDYCTDIVDKCSSMYGYNYLGSLSNGAKLQSFYNNIDESLTNFHKDESKNATEKTIASSKYYIASDLDYSSIGLSQNEAISVWSVYRDDHPLFYWISGNVLYTSSSLSICVDENYKIGNVRKNQNNKLYDSIYNYLNIVSNETLAYQIAFAFHDEIINNIDYARDSLGQPENSSWAHSIVGVFDNNKAVCEGYAKAFSLLLNACGVNNAYVTGTSKGEGHAWNLVEIENNNWYWYDLTWDDQPNISSGIIYDYMCINGESFNEHSIANTGDFSNPINFRYVLPTASSTVYDTSDYEYGDTFIKDNYTFEVCGYNKVKLVSTNLNFGTIELNKIIVINERKFFLFEIGQNAFKNNINITEIIIPESVIVINNFAFKGCTMLSIVEFKDTTRWQRTSKKGTEQIKEVDLKVKTIAAQLLKETYNEGSYMYQYVWIKKVG